MAYSMSDVLIAGFAASGKAVDEKVRFFGGATYIYDDNGKYSDFETIEKLIKEKKISLCVTSPSIPFNHPILKIALQNGIEVISELEFGFSLFCGEIVAITGTNGKTTTVSLLDEIMKEDGRIGVLCGNVGVPITSVSSTKKTVGIVEVSSFQLEGIKTFKPKIAAILNFSPDHLDRHGTYEKYISAKKRIYENQDSSDFLILPPSLKDECVSSSKRYFFSSTEKTNGAHLEKDNIVFGDGEYVTGIYNVRLKGKHNLENVLAAITAAKLIGAKNLAIERAVSSFCGVKHRISYVRELCGVRYYNDSKGTNVSSTLVALDAMVGDVVLIAGGKDKGLSFDELFAKLPKKTKAIVVFGENAEKLVETAERFSYEKIYRVKTLKESVLEARYLARGGNVLFSPASSSFDMFANYEERGECFEKIVRAL